MTKLENLHALRNRALADRSAITDKVKAEQRANLTDDETRRFREIVARLHDLDAQIAQHHDDEARSGKGDPLLRGLTVDGGGDWATRAATALTKLGGEARAIASGSIEVPTILSPAVTPKSRPARLTDLLVNRVSLQSNSYTYWRQTVRTNAAAPVADLGTKPTSTFTLTEIEDRARVIAHLSEEIPIRLWQDAEDVVRWLEAEMVAGVLDKVEQQVISGAGTGEQITGLLSISGTTAVAYATDVPTTLRKAITALQAIGVTPNAWVLNPSDAEALDLLREGTGGVGFLLDGVTETNAGSGNVLGSNAITRVISPSVPQGQAVLGDWTQIRLAVREDMRLDVDAGGTLFTKNAAILRAETRVGVQHLHPASFAIADLTA